MPTRKPAGISVPKKGRLGSLFKVPIDYILETDDGDFVTLPNTPSFYMQSRPTASVLTYTINGYVKENSPYRSTHIELRGQSGYAPRTGYNRDGDLIYQSGLVILEEFDHWLNEWQKKASNKSYLVFRSLKEGFAYKVSVEKWDFQKDADSNRFSYQWALSLHAYAEPSESKLVSIFFPIDQFINQLTDGIDTINASIAILSNAAANLDAEIRNVALEPLRALERSTKLLSDITKTVANSIYGIPSAVLSSVYNIAGNARRALGNLQATYPYEVFDEYALNPAKTAVRELYSQVELVERTVIELSIGSRGLIGEQNTNTDDLIELAKRQASIPYLLRAGESLRDIAGRVYGDKNLVSILIDFNGFLDERTHGDGAPILAGDTLFIPSLIEDRDALYPKRGDSIFYTDLALSADGDLILDDNDLRLITDESNLKQAIINRVLTEQGTFKLVPTYGLPALIGDALDNRANAILVSSIREQLLLDPRISSIKQVSLLIEGDSIAVTCTLIGISGVTIPLIIPVRQEI
jgi:hypothetical protein